jgi:yeast amino acid transporter
VAICSFRFRAALRAQNDPLLKENEYSYRTIWWPVPPGYLLCGSLLLLVCCIFLGVSGGVAPTAYSFFQYNLGVVLILGAGLGYKIIFDTKFRRLQEIDLVTGRARMTVDQRRELDDYRAMTRGKRLLTYIKLW